MNILKIFKPNQTMPNDAVQSLALVSDRPSLTYNSGELVTGHCIITTNGTLDFSQIEIKLSGKAKVVIPCSDSQHQHHQQQNIPGQTQHNQTVNCIQKCSLIKLVYNPATVHSGTLATGRHAIGYSFLVPPNMPSSLEYQFGFIKYRLKAKVKGANSKKSELTLNIISNPAVSPYELKNPICLANEKTVGLIGGKRVWLKCEIPQTGFSLGTQIPITCSINNQSKKLMTLKGSLKQEITFKAEEHQRTITNKLTVINGPQINQKSDIKHNLSLLIPINLPIVHNTCPIISIKYIVSVKLDIPGSFDLVCKMPVILTNIPIPNP